MNQMIKTIKEVHKEHVCLFKIGNFYHAYGRDAYILAYMFDYKIKNIEKDKKECGFPVSIIGRITAKLEGRKINYILIDNRNNYYVDQKYDKGNLNQYKNIYEKARNYVNYNGNVNNNNYNNNLGVRPVASKKLWLC